MSLIGCLNASLKCDDMASRKTACFKNSAITEFVLGILLFCLLGGVSLIRLLQSGKVADHSGIAGWIIVGLGFSLSVSMIAVGGVKLCIARKKNEVVLEQV